MSDDGENGGDDHGESDRHHADESPERAGEAAPGRETGQGGGDRRRRGTRREDTRGRGRSRPRGGGDSPSYGEVVTRPRVQSQVKFGAALYTVVGVGMGLLLFVLDLVALSPVTLRLQRYSYEQGETVTKTRPLPVISGEFLYPLLIVLAVGISVFLAVRIAGSALDDRETVAAAGLATGVGSALLVLVGGGLSFQKLRYVELVLSLTEEAERRAEARERFMELYSVDPLGLVGNAALVGLVIGLTSVGVVYVLRNLDPQTPRGESAEDSRPREAGD